MFELKGFPANIPKIRQEAMMVGKISEVDKIIDELLLYSGIQKRATFLFFLLCLGFLIMIRIDSNLSLWGFVGIGIIMWLLIYGALRLLGLFYGVNLEAKMNEINKMLSQKATEINK